MLAKQIHTYLDLNNYGLYIYGSSAIDFSHGRDIDAVAISPDISETLLHEFNISLEHELRTCNLYLVPEQVYLDDVYNLAYGGYYAHKFAICFAMIAKRGTNINAPFGFWANELRNYLMHESSKQIPEPATLIKYVHGKIFRFRPDFIRPLLKFISNIGQQLTLRDYVASEIIPKSREIVTYSVDTSQYDDEKAFYLYWKEYNRHKHNRTLWGERTFMKLSDSCRNKEVAEVEKYLGSLWDYMKSETR